MRFARVVLIVLAGLVALAAAGFVALRLIFPPERIKAEVVARAEEATGYDLELARAGLGISLRGLTVQLTGLAVRNPARAVEDPLLRLDRLELGVELFPLLQREIHVTRLDLVKPQVFLYKDRGGKLNAKVERPPAAATAAPPAGGAGFLLAVPAASITDGSLRFVDEVAHTQVAVADLDGDLRVRVEPDTVRLRADIVLDGVRADMTGGGGAAYGPLRIAVKSDLAHAPASGATLVRGATLGLAAIDLTIDGRVDAPPSQPGAAAEGAQPTLDLALASGEFEPAKVLSLLGQSLPEGVRVDGTARLAATVRGRANAPDVAGTLAISGVNVTPPEKSSPLLTGLGGEIGFTRSTLAARGIRGALGGTPFTLSATVDDFVRPRVKGGVEFKAQLTDLAALVELPPDMALERGTIAADIDFSTRAPDFAGALELSGNAQGQDIAGRVPGLPVPVRDLNFTARLKGRQGTIEPFRLTLGRSDVGGRLAVERLDPPTLTFALSSSRVDLDELLAKPAGAAAPTEPAAKKEPPPMAPMRGTLRASELIYRQLTAREASLELTLDQNGLRVDDVRASLLGGSLGGDLAVDFADPDSLRYTSNLVVRGVQANEILSATTPVKNLIYGRLDMKLDLAGIKAGEISPASFLTALGDATVTEGHLPLGGVLGGIASQMGLLADGRNTLEFQRLATVFRVEQGRVKFRETTIGGARSGEYNLSGSVGLDGTLDYQVAALLPKRYLPPELANRPDVLALVTDSSGRVPVDFTIRGTIKDPKVRIDMQKIQDRVVSGAKREVQSRVEAEASKQFDKTVKEAARGLGSLFGTKKTAPAGADSGQAAPR